MLESFIGTWKTSGRIRAIGNEPEMTLAGTDTYEWLVGESVILHRVDVLMGDERVRSAEVIGPEEGGYFMRSYDPTGEAGVMKATFADGVWSFTGEQQRFRGGFSETGETFSGLWEQKGEDGTWMPWMDLQLERA